VNALLFVAIVYGALVVLFALTIMLGALVGRRRRRRDPLERLYNLPSAQPSRRRRVA